MHGAYKNDKDKTAAAAAAGASSSTPNPIPTPTTATPSTRPSSTSSTTEETPILDLPRQTNLTPEAEEEARRLDAELEKTHAADKVEDTPVRTGAVLRVHKIYMNARREFEIRTDKEGKLELWDAMEKKIIS
jgi:hypothetical protein